jgi:hypothetical protein
LLKLKFHRGVLTNRCPIEKTTYNAGTVSKGASGLCSTDFLENMFALSKVVELGEEFDESQQIYSIQTTSNLLTRGGVGNQRLPSCILSSKISSTNAMQSVYSFY